MNVPGASEAEAETEEEGVEARLAAFLLLLFLSLFGGLAATASSSSAAADEEECEEEEEEPASLRTGREEVNAEVEVEVEAPKYLLDLPG